MSELGAAVARTRHSLTDAASGSGDKGKARYSPSLDEEYAWSLATEGWTLQEREEVSKALGLSSEDTGYVFDGYSDARGFGDHKWGGGICHCLECVLIRRRGLIHPDSLHSCTRNRTPRTYASSSAYRLPEVRPARCVVNHLDRMHSGTHALFIGMPLVSRAWTASRGQSFVPRAAMTMTSTVLSVSSVPPPRTSHCSRLRVAVSPSISSDCASTWTENSLACSRRRPGSSAPRTGCTAAARPAPPSSVRPRTGPL